MRAIHIFLITIVFLIQNISPLQAQTTDGKDFWLTFGRNYTLTPDAVDMQIRIVSGNQPVEGTIHFTGVKTTIPFSIPAQQVFTYPIVDNVLKDAVYNQIMGVSKRSIHITTNKNVTVYALNQWPASADATNVLPITALGTDYYQISYMPTGGTLDAYAVVATENNTRIYHNGVAPVEMLNAGEVYYRTLSSDMTGAHVTSDKPVAFFALDQIANVPNSAVAADCLFQQLAPVHTWGKKFFVPVSFLTKDIVRIVASEDETKITQIGGTLLFPVGGQTSLDNLQAGQFVELMVSLSNQGCYIQSDKPVGVCAYLTGQSYNNLGLSDPAQCWLPAIEQTITEALIAPFTPSGQTNLTMHRSLVVTPTATKNNTRVSIGDAPPAPLSGGNWIDNTTENINMSFYDMPLTNTAASYYFTNDAGLIIMGYGVGGYESYYFLSASSMRNLSAAFFANDVASTDMANHPFCENTITFTTEISGISPDPGSLKWYINNVLQTNLTDIRTWTHTFATGTHTIKMSVLFEDGTTNEYTGTLIISTCSAAFYANNVYYENLKDTIICTNDVYFRADIEGLQNKEGSLQWFINGVEEVEARDHLEWSKPFETGLYEIEMRVIFVNDATATISGKLKMYIPWIKIQNVKH
jgi:hypothetical protein